MRMAMETPETAVLVLRWGFQDPQGVSGDALANIFKETRCGHCGNPLVHWKRLVASVYQKRFLEPERFDGCT